MTNHEFENYLALLGKLLRLSDGQREQIGYELRDHLESRVAELVESGVSSDEATRTALEEFGDASALAGQFQAISQTYRRRWMMRFATFSIAGCFLVVVLTMAMWPDNARFGAPETSLAQNKSPVSVEHLDKSTSSDPVQGLSERSKRNLETQAKLNQSVEDDFSFDEKPFEEVTDELLDVYQIRVLLDRSARDDALTWDEPLTFGIAGVPLKTAIRLMLLEKNATYMIDNGIIRVISRDVADDPSYFRRQIFDCRNIIAQLKIAEKDRIGQVKSNAGGGGFGGGKPTSGGGLGGGGLFALQDEDTTQGSSQNNKTSDTKTYNALVELIALQKQQQHSRAVLITAESLLKDLIQSTIHPENWSSTNGESTLDIVGGLAVVIAPEAILDDINDLLQDIEFRLDSE